MSALMKHLGDQQEKALHLRTMLDALQLMNLEKLDPKTQGDLIGSACMLARDINISLDIVNLPEEEPAPVAETPVIALYRQYAAITDEAEAHPSIDDDELDRLFYNRRDEIEDRMMALPCQTPADFAAKSIIAHCHGGVVPDWETNPIWIEARALVGGAA
jgi:hypothetical protein